MKCTVYDQCYRFGTNEDAVLEFLNNNFVRHYEQLRAPYPLFGHSQWMTGVHNEYKKKGLLNFIHSIIFQNTNLPL